MRAPAISNRPILKSLGSGIVYRGLSDWLNQLWWTYGFSKIGCTSTIETYRWPQKSIRERIFRVGDRVLHRRNNYDLGVLNGEIGIIQKIDNEELTCVVSFFPDL